MPQDITLRVGNDSAVHIFTGSAAQVRISIVRVCKSLGISTEGTPAEVGARLLAHIVDDLRRRAEAQSIQELEVGQSVTNVATAKSDNPL